MPMPIPTQRWPWLCGLLGHLMLVVAPVRGQEPPPPKPAEPPKPALECAGHTSEVYAVAFAPDGRRLASASNREVLVWDAATGKQVLNYPIKGANVYGLAFRPDGKQLAVGIAHTIKLLDADTGKETQTINIGTHFLFRLAYRPDGKQLAAATGLSNNAGDVRIWDVESGKELLCLKGHTEAPLNVAYSADGRRLATSSGGTNGTKPGEIKVWDAATLERFAGLERALEHGAGLHVPDLDPGERLPLAGLDELEIDDRARVGVDHEFQAFADVTRVHGGRFLVA